MKSDNNSWQPKIDPKIGTILARMQELQTEHLSRKADIVKNAGPELLSNSSSSFIIPVTLLFLAGFSLYVASPIVGTVVGFNLAASSGALIGLNVSVLGIKLASLLAPVKQTDFEHTMQIVSGSNALTLSTIGQLAGGNQWFETLGKLGESIDEMADMKSNLHEMYETDNVLKRSIELFKYYQNLYELGGSAVVVENLLQLTSERSSDSPMTTINVETDSLIEKIQRDSALKTQIEEVKKNTSQTNDSEITKLREENRTFWDQYDKARAQIHNFEQHPPITQSPQYYLPKIEVVRNMAPGAVKRSIPSYESNPYISIDLDYSTGRERSLLNNGGTSTSDSGFESPQADPVEMENDGSESGGIGEGPMG
jgi:hypothetical protein